MAVVSLRPHTQRVVYPRALFARLGRGVALGPPGDRATQREVLRQAFDLLVGGTTPGEVRDYASATVLEGAPQGRPGGA
ncbi:MAG: hypothetical protein HY685_01625 [Chloroflexi bacterium]|nr:hypothetical protein [Chloroflexota bacterium]